MNFIFWFFGKKIMSYLLKEGFVVISNKSWNELKLNQKRKRAPNKPKTEVKENG